MKIELKINKEIFLENLKSQIRYAKKNNLQFEINKDFIIGIFEEYILQDEEFLITNLDTIFENIKKEI